MLFVTIALAWARTHPAPLGGRPPIEAIHTPDGDDQAEVIVRDVRIVPSDHPAERVDATQGSPHHRESAWVVRFELTKVFKGHFPRRELRILVHSPSRDLGVSHAGQRGVLYRDRSRTGWEYRFVAE
jgi:hypothetical protein